MTQMSLSTKQTHRHRKQTCGCQEGWGWGGMDWECGVGRYKLLHTGWINSTFLLDSTENPLQSPGISHSGKGCENEYICVCSTITLRYSGN